ncbi:hypothetical protein GCM10017083_43890 [Thalassobaculum fulvum]|uniref:Uncharacterized protein n=1 Tax=Thalassobaculum fulvum TaxID=1633335 RepID=A0A918XWR6_9PROT|nr:hypothetical protein [Thalassobaculum fulvum]GHD59543.1 hypothetical protein GCM10017083_43890 [Thalassobaculum fulvum]
MPDAMRPGSVIADYDRDSIHTLPLTVLPVSNAALSRARLIRNHRLETRVELFRETGIGSGQIAIDEIPDFFTGDVAALHDDMALLRRIGQLPALDPYTLRIGLRQAGVDVLSLEALQLSPAKRAELLPLMRNITRPLIVHLYGDGRAAADDLDGIIRLIAYPDTPRVRARIRSMAEALQISVDALPDMLEDYGDTYLALSYYRSYFQYALPVIGRILEWMREVRTESFLRTDANAQRTFQQVEDVLAHVTGSVTRRFEGFDRHTVVNWDRVTVGTFAQVRELISQHQQSLAAVLCGLTVKIYEWEQRFPNGGGSPDKRAEFVATDLRPGLDGLWALERRAPRFEAGLAAPGQRRSGGTA